MDRELTLHTSMPVKGRTLARTVQSRPWIPRIGVGVVLALVVALALQPLISTPRAVPANAAATLFSAERALKDLAVIAAEPHPIGSPRNAEVRDYLLAQIRALGLEPEVQSTLHLSTEGVPSLAAVDNILVRVPGVAGRREGAVLISGHYDSIATTAGAADCAACTVAVLEALRAMRAGEPLQNDVIFLFSDGEEVGVVGAAAFMEQHPWAEDVAMSLVFEGYGPRGASILYVADPQGGWAVNEALAAASRPTGYSFVHTLMWTLAGNSGSDLDALLEGDAPGLGFINLTLDGAPAYHTLDDAAANLDAGTLQSHGDWAVALIRHFGNLSLESRASTPTPIYFALVPGLSVRYPANWAMGLAIAAATLLAVALVAGIARTRISSVGVAAGMAIWLVGLVLAIGLVTLVWWGVRWLNVNLHAYRVGGWYGASLYLLAFCALALAVAAWGWRLLARFDLYSVWAGALVMWATLGVLIARSLTGFSYALAWPLLAASAVLLWRASRRSQGEDGAKSTAAAALPTLMAVFLLTPIIYLLGLYGGRLEAMSGLPGAALPTLFVMLLAGMALPVGAWLGNRRYGRLAMGALMVSLALIGAGWLRSMPTAQRPAANTIVYWLDADSNTARWIAINDSRMGRGTRGQIDAWTRQYLGDTPQTMQFNPWINGWLPGPHPALYAPAPVVDAYRSSVMALAQSEAGATRTYALRIEPPAQALDGQIVIAVADGSLSDVRVNDIPLRGVQAGPQVQINRYGPTGAWTVEFTATDSDEVVVTVRDRTLGLPVPGAAGAPARTAAMIPAPLNASADSTIVEQTFHY